MILCATRHRLWQPVPALLNDRPKDRCKALWGEIAQGKLPDSFAEVWAQESALLMPVPRPFDGFIEHIKRVSPHLSVALRTQPLQRAGLFGTA